MAQCDRPPAPASHSTLSSMASDLASLPAATSTSVRGQSGAVMRRGWLTNPSIAMPSSKHHSPCTPLPTAHVESQTAPPAPPLHAADSGVAIRDGVVDRDNFGANHPSARALPQSRNPPTARTPRAQRAFLATHAQCSRCNERMERMVEATGAINQSQISYIQEQAK
ncbi:hypothetical protein A1Q2_03513 [Trichosporon asahii var. asahii CBS 8904]|uniref:Uncharacterized protein n=1 Tax=Trichosporon asahii var. asahii (strain CBS 8904) TaxID=1220162 RepID=K1VNG5_TRIAC|nr:hypothetical protein A1Q2_03513 [Trichosporon asahii var. asahii CBS 8904]